MIESNSRYIITVASETNGPFWQVCPACGGSGYIKAWMLSGTANHIKTLIENRTCDLCNGRGKIAVVVNP